jgi:hypothetical protein
LGVLGCRVWLAVVALAWIVAEIFRARDASEKGPLGGGGGGVAAAVVAAVVAADSMCCCVELIHRARMGSRKVGGRRDTGHRSSRAERAIDLLIVTAGWGCDNLAFSVRLG